MNTKRSWCETCTKSREPHERKEIMSVAEAQHHSENYMNHHVIVNPDTEEKLAEEKTANGIL